MEQLRQESVRTDRYNPAMIVLHWLTFLLLAGVYAAIELHEFYPRGSDLRESLETWHYMLGLTVFALVWLRLLVRALSTSPAPIELGWRYVVSKVTHTALYLLMIAMPVAGWLILSAEGDAIPFSGLELPPLVGPNDGLAEQVEELHELGGTIGYWLIGFHAAAALFHHYVLRDGLMVRLLPGSSRRSAAT